MTNPRELSEGERSAILGPGSDVPYLCPLWAKLGESGRKQVTRDHPFKLVETIKCLCASCPYELRIVRILGSFIGETEDR